MAAADPDDYRMSFGEHLEELRGRMIRALIGVAVAAGITFFFGEQIVLWLTRPLQDAQAGVGLPPVTITRTPLAAFFLYMKVSLIGAVVVAGPWIMYQAWKFVAAGLYAHERRVAYILAPFSSTMTVLGIVFTYYVMLPVTLIFLMKFAVSFGPRTGDVVDPDPASPPANTAVEPDGEIALVPQLEIDPPHPKPGQIWVNSKDNALKVRVGQRIMVAYLAVSSPVNPLIDLAEYIDFVLLMMLGVAFAFQLPVAMLVVGWTGILQAQLLGRYRKYMFFICFCLGAIITPSSDPLSMTLMAMPLYLLFELGLLLMRATQRDVDEDEEEDEEDEEEEDDDDDDEDDEDDEEEENR